MPCWFLRGTGLKFKALKYGTPSHIQAKSMKALHMLHYQATIPLSALRGLRAETCKFHDQAFVCKRYVLVGPERSFIDSHLLYDSTRIKPCNFTSSRVGATSNLLSSSNREVRGFRVIDKEPKEPPNPR